MGTTSCSDAIRAVTLITAFVLLFPGRSQAQQRPELPVYGTEAYLKAEPPKTEEGVRAVVEKLGRDLYARRDFEEIDKIAAELLAKKSRTPSGLWKLALFGYGVDEESQPRIPSEEGWLVTERRLKSWIEKYPKSPSAHIAYANALIGHAWFVRGNSYAANVKPEAWPRFRKYLDEAAEVLLASKSFASHDPRWYIPMLSLATYQQWDQRKFTNLVKEALNKEPLYYPNYFAAILYYAPKWGGSQALMEKFVKESVDRTAKLEGNAMYARIYWYVSQIDCDCDLFSDTKAYWPKMKQSFETVIKQYPDDWNINHYARFACEANDFQKAATLLDRLDGRISQDAWGRTGILARCLEEIFQLRLNPKVIG